MTNPAPNAAGAMPTTPDELFSSAFNGNPWPLYTRLRETAPVSWSPSQGVAVVAGHAEVRQALTDARFSSQPSSPMADSLLGTTFRSLDGEAHRRTRAMFATMLRQPDLTARIIDPLLARLMAGLQGPEVEFVGALAEPAAIGVASQLLGIAEEDGHWLYLLLHAVLESAGEYGFEQRIGVRDKLFERMDQWLDAAPDGSMLAQAARQVTGGAIIRLDAVRNLLLLYAGATKPMAAALANVLACLASHPQAWRMARAESHLIPAIVAECLRLQTPLDLVGRFAATDLELGRCRIDAGTPLLLALASANRDAAHFAQADNLDPQRAQRANLAFGAGAHACIGRQLAQQLLESTVRACLQRFATIEPGGAAAMIVGPFVRMPRTLELRVSLT